jgi:hypothetical protein
MAVIDTNNDTSTKLDMLKMRGVTAIGRYYASKGSKRLTASEAKAICKAGMLLFVVFEDGGDPVLTFESGVADAQKALGQAAIIGQPTGSAIYFAMEHLPNGFDESHLEGVRSYVSGVRAGLNGDYKLGLYSDGVICKAMLDQGLCDLAWLSASRGFPGSKAFYASRRWALAQDPRVDQDWNGLSIDLNESQGDFGAFQVSVVSLALGHQHAR